MRISYAPEAIDDLKRLRAFIQEKNPPAAQRIANSLLKGISQLKRFPNLGVEVQQAPHPEMVRDLIIGRYTVRYLIRANKIDILRIWHHEEQRL